MAKVTKSEPFRPVVNTVNPAAVKAPSVTLLRGVLGAWQFQSKNHEIPWSTKKPAGAVLNEVVVKAPPKKGTGDSITAFQLKSDPTKVYYAKGGSTQMHYFGPVSLVAIPK